MAIAVTAKYEEFVFEVEVTAGSGTFSKLCGLKDVTVTRTNTTDTTEIPDCDDESLPYKLERSVRSQDLTISATGVWALSSDKVMKDWFYGGLTKLARIRNVKVENSGVTGDYEAETFPLIMTELSNERTKGQSVQASVSFERDGDTTLAAKA